MTMRDLLPDLDVRRTLRSGGRTTAHLASQVAFIVFLGLLILIGATTNIVVLAALATFALFFMLRAALPAEWFDDFAHDLMTGEAGVRFYDWLLGGLSKLRSKLPW
jgi:hypothetical protein